MPLVYDAIDHEVGAHPRTEKVEWTYAYLCDRELALNLGRSCGLFGLWVASFGGVSSVIRIGIPLIAFAQLFTIVWGRRVNAGLRSSPLITS